MNANKEKLAALESKLRTILPDLYQDSYEDVQPVSMGSAALKYDQHGQVAWGDMWDTFCDLAMAGGPPHKGTLLRPAAKAEIDAEPDNYLAVAEEICRGIALVSDLDVKLSTYPGWIAVQCDDALMAEWLVRAIVMENVSAHWNQSTIFLPAGPAYRIEKEIKNVVTVIAKTCHYWVDHMWYAQQLEISKLFAAMAEHTPLVQPPFPELAAPGNQYEDLGRAIYEKIVLQISGQNYGWLGIECSSIKAAIWMMRGMVVSNVLARREGVTLLVPVANHSGAAYEHIVQTVGDVYSLAQEKGIS